MFHVRYRNKDVSSSIGLENTDIPHELDTMNLTVNDSNKFK